MPQYIDTGSCTVPFIKWKIIKSSIPFLSSSSSVIDDMDLEDDEAYLDDSVGDIRLCKLIL